MKRKARILGPSSAGTETASAMGCLPLMTPLTVWTSTTIPAIIGSLYTVETKDSTSRFGTLQKPRQMEMGLRSSSSILAQRETAGRTQYQPGLDLMCPTRIAQKEQRKAILGTLTHG